MNLGLVLSILVSSLGHVQAINSSNPECEDLDRLQSNMAKAIKAASGSVKCKPNSNCTGLECSGKLKDKPFHGTVLFEGCHDPVRMLVHVNKKSLYVKDGFNRKVMSKPVPVHMQVYLKKKAGIVYVTLIAKACLVSKFCLPIKILNNQEIRVRCNGSAWPTIPSWSSDPTTQNKAFSAGHKSGNSSGGGGSTMPPWSSDPTTQHKAFSGGHKSGNSSGGGVSSLGRVQAINSSNPECEDLDRLQSTMANAIKAASGSVKCKPNSNCTGLECNGKIKDKPFHGTVLLEGCHDPVRMLIHVNKKSLYVKDGFNRKVMSKPVPVHMQVKLKKKAGIVYVTLIAKVCLVSKFCLPAVNILNNQEIRVRCNGSAWPTMPPWSSDPTTQNKAFSAGHKSGNSSGGGGKSLSGGAIAAIVIGVVIFFVILIAVIVWIVRGKRQRIARYNDLAMNDDTDPLCFDSEPIA